MTDGSLENPLNQNRRKDFGQRPEIKSVQLIR
jgi:hypothetical protein